MAGDFDSFSKALQTVYLDKALDAMVNSQSPFRKFMQQDYGADVIPPHTTFYLLAQQTLKKFARSKKDWKFLCYADEGAPIAFNKARHVDNAAWVTVFSKAMKREMLLRFEVVWDGRAWVLAVKDVA